MCPVLKLRGAARVTPQRLRDACAILSASLPQSSPSTPIPTAYSLPPFFQLFLWLCVFVWCLRVLGSAIYVYTVCWQCARKSIWENRSQLVAEWSRAEARPIKRKLYSRAKAHNTVQGRNGRVAKLQQRFASWNFPKVKLTEKTPLKQGWIEKVSAFIRKVSHSW